jgi:hypothetical protein
MKPKPKEKTQKATGDPTQPHWHEMNRKQRLETMRKIQSEDLSLEMVHPDAAGIDIGNESHYVAVPPTRDSQPVRRFGCTTAELKVMAEWLKQCRIRTIAMQSTGVYWIAVYDILEEAAVSLLGLSVPYEPAHPSNSRPGQRSRNRFEHRFLRGNSLRHRRLLVKIDSRRGTAVAENTL